MRLYLTERREASAVHGGGGLKEDSISGAHVSRVSTTKRLTQANRRFLLSLGFKLKKKK